MNERMLLEMQYRMEIADQLAEKYCRGVDTLNWGAFASIFDEELETDFYHPVLAHCPKPTRYKVDEWIDFCRLMNGFDSSQHCMTNHLYSFDGDHAQVRVYLQSEHFLGGAGNAIGGEYLFYMNRRPSGWKIYKYTLRPMWAKGDQTLFEKAKERVAKGINVRPSSG